MKVKNFYRLTVPLELMPGYNFSRLLGKTKHTRTDPGTILYFYILY